jgi:hypothetical protein
LGKKYFIQSLPKIFERILDPREYVREGFIGVFVFIPGILKEGFEPYIKEVLENILEFVSAEDEKIREMSLRVLRMLI